MTYQYILFVDEAGDDKVGHLKPANPNGNSEWLCLGGYLVRESEEPSLSTRRDALLKEVGGNDGGYLHFRNYKLPNRVKVCKKLAEYPARAFVVCSFKRTMIGHRNVRAEAASGTTNQYLFNFVCRLLLERVTEFVASDAEAKGIDDPVLRIVMANRKGHHFGAFKAYVLQLMHQATAGSTFLNTREIKEHVLRYDQIDREPARKLPGLQLADAVVSSVFQSIEQASPHYPEQPARHLRPIFAGKPKWQGGPIWRQNVGMTLYPAKEAINMLEPSQLAFFQHFDYNADWWKKLSSRNNK